MRLDRQVALLGTLLSLASVVAAQLELEAPK